MAGGNGGAPLTFLLAAAIAGCVLRAAFGLGYWNDQALTRDETEYLSLARSLAAGHGFTYDEVMVQGPIVPFGRAPGYPAFLAMVGGGRGLTASVPASVQVAQSLIGGVGVVLVGLLAFRLAGVWAARVASLMAAVYPPLVWIAGYALSEALFWPIGLGCALLYEGTAGRARSRTRTGFALGVLTGVGVLVRPALLLFAVLAGLTLLTRDRRRACAAFAIGVFVVVGPWTVRNYGVHDRLMLVASDGGVTFWTGNHALAIGEGDMAANPALKIANQELRAQYPGRTEEQMEPIYYREALKWILDHPWDFVTLELKKMFYLVVPIGPSYTLHSTRYFVASVVSYGALLILAVAGARRLGPLLARTPGLWILLLSSILVSLIFFPQERFRVPIVDPVLIVLASGLAAGSRRPGDADEAALVWTQPD